MWMTIPPRPEKPIHVLVRFKHIAHKDGRLEKTDIPEVYFSEDGKSETKAWRKIAEVLGPQYLHLEADLSEKKREVNEKNQRISNLLLWQQSANDELAESGDRLFSLRWELNHAWPWTWLLKLILPRKVKDWAYFERKREVFNEHEG